jgi:predicted outer membrane repeat protein
LQLETLEDRTAPALLTVTTASDQPGESGTLRDAVMQANSDAGGGQSDTIGFAASLAGQTITLTQGVLVLSGASSTSPATITIDGGGQITVDGNHASGVFEVNGGVTASLSGLTIVDGHTPGDGGAISNAGTLSVSNSTFSNNSADAGQYADTGGDGGAISNAGTLSVSNSTFSNNSASGGQYSGGVGGALSDTGTLSVSNSTFSNNSAFGGVYFGGVVGTDTSGGVGGAISSAGTLSVSSSTFSNNSAATTGGAIHTTGTPLSVSSSTFSNNSATYGGGIYTAVTLSVSSSTFSKNSAAYGGGIFSYGDLTVSSSTFSNNSAGPTYGGGGAIANAGALSVSSSTFSNNSAGEGGGILNEIGTLSVSSSTFSNNRSSKSGGGISTRSRATLSLEDTIVAGNSAPSSPDIFGTFTDQGHNLLGTALQGSAGPGDVFSDQPLLAPLADYGGPTQTLALLPGSPALDAGDPSDTSVDQRGVAVQNGRRDIGAFESHGFTITVTSGNNQQTAPDTAFASPLEVTVTANDPSEPVAGGQVRFAAPTSGASTWLTGSPASIDGNGNASVTATANYTAGSYSVTASAGPTYATSFSLTNRFSPGFSDLLSPRIVYATATTTLSGHLSSPLPDGGAYVPPGGEEVEITINGVTMTTALGGSGDFSVAFPTAKLGVAGSPYSVTYAYPGDPICSSANNSSSTLTVTPAPLTAVVTVNNKVYDGTTAASIASETLSGTIFNSDVVKVTGGTATFDTADPGTGKTVTVTGLSLTGAAAGNYALSSSTVTTTADSTKAPLQAAALTAPAATEGQPLQSMVLWHFTDPYPRATASEYKATVTWGDGTTEDSVSNPGDVQVVANPGGGFDVVGAHTFGEEATGLGFAALVEDSAGAAGLSGNASLNVTDAALTAGTLTPPPNPVPGTPISKQVLLHFSDANPKAAASDYTATVTWGDGTVEDNVSSPSTVAVVADGDGFDVVGSHTYLQGGLLSFHVAVTDLGGASTSQSGSVSAATDAVVPGTSGDDTLLLMRATAGPVGSVSYILNNNSPVTLRDIASFTFDGNDGNDTMTVSLGNGRPLLPGFVHFDGGTGSNTLTLDAASTALDGVLLTQPGRILADGQAISYASVGTTNLDNSVAVNVTPGPDTVDRDTALASLSSSERFVQALYLDVLGRAGAKAELDGWLGTLKAGGQQAVAAGIEGTFEARDRLVQTWYRAYLGRTAAGGEERGWVNLLLAGQSEEQVLGQVLGAVGGEFYQRAQTLIPQGSADQRYVQALYQVLLGRSAGSAELAGWLTALPGMGRAGVARAILQGSEARSDVFVGYYEALLHRPSSSSDQPFLSAMIGSGVDDYSVRLLFEAGPEFFANG